MDQGVCVAPWFLSFYAFYALYGDPFGMRDLSRAMVQRSSGPALLQATGWDKLDYDVDFCR